MGAEPPFHLQDIAAADAQVFGHGLDFVMAEPAQALLGGTQIEKQFALRLGGCHLDDAPVAQDVFMHLGADPVYGEGHQPHPDLRVKTLHRLHEADIAFLDQVCLRQTVAVITARHAHDKTQVRQHQFPRRVQIVMIAITPRQLLLALGADHGDLVDGMYIGLQRPGR